MQVYEARGNDQSGYVNHLFVGSSSTRAIEGLDPAALDHEIGSTIDAAAGVEHPSTYESKRRVGHRLLVL
jgi:hypothetical protein